MDKIKEFEKNLFKAINRACGCISEESMSLLKNNMDLVQTKHLKAVRYYCRCWECRNELKDLFGDKIDYFWSTKDDPNQLELVPEENFFDQFREIEDYFPEEVNNIE